jgi:hypothetical protein
MDPVSESEGAAVAWTEEPRRGASRQASAPSSDEGRQRFKRPNGANN